MVLPWQRVAEFLLESVFPEQIISQLVQLGNWSQEGSWDGEECGEGTGPPAFPTLPEEKPCAGFWSCPGGAVNLRPQLLPLCDETINGMTAEVERALQLLLLSLHIFQ